MYGIPVHAWDNRTFENIASLWGDFVRIDGATSAAVSFKRAQALIETDWLCNIDEVINLEVKGDMFEVRVVEIERGAVRFDRDDVLVSESEEIGKRQEEEVQSDKASWRATAVQEGDSRKVQRISEVMFSSCPPKERLIDSQHLAKKLRGRPCKKQPVSQRFANASLTDSDFEHRKDVILREARETLQLGKLLGPTNIGNEEVVVRDLAQIITCQDRN
ncbi:hypothetical protein V6N13_009215 [Hibiscus sabdariffa]